MISVLFDCFWHSQVFGGSHAEHVKFDTSERGTRDFELLKNSTDHTPQIATDRTFINSYMYPCRPISLIRDADSVQRTADSGECQVIPKMSVKLFSVFQRDVCSSYCCADLLEARFPHCNCWKAKPVEIGQDTACERDAAGFREVASSFSAYFASGACVREKLRDDECGSVLVSCGKLSLGRFHKRGISLIFTHPPNRYIEYCMFFVYPPFECIFLWIVNNFPVPVLEVGLTL